MVLAPGILGRRGGGRMIPIVLLTEAANTSHVLQALFEADEAAIGAAETAAVIGAPRIIALRLRPRRGQRRREKEPEHEKHGLHGHLLFLGRLLGSFLFHEFLPRLLRA